MTKTKTSFAHGQLKGFIERIERLEEEKRTISGDIKEVYAEAKANGFDTKIMRLIVRLRKKEAAEREEEQSMLDVYMAALGMLPDEVEAYGELAKGLASGEVEVTITVNTPTPPQATAEVQESALEPRLGEQGA